MIDRHYPNPNDPRRRPTPPSAGDSTSDGSAAGGDPRLPHAPPPSNYVPQKGTEGRLLLNGRDVGRVVVEGWDSPWTHGRFTPGEAFSEFAPLFGRWSLLMHEDEQEPLHASAAAALADAERQMDALHVHIHFEKPGIFQLVREVNIDGGMIEWREF